VICHKEPNLRTGKKGLAELERIKNIKRDKKRMGDTSGLLKNLLLYAAKNPEAKGALLSRETLIFEDFNYQNFNPIILAGLNERSKESESEDELEEARYEDESLLKELKMYPITEEEIAKIRKGQQREELFDIQQLRTEVNSQGIGTIQVSFD